MDKELKLYEYVFDPDLMTGIETIALVENPATEIIAIQLSAQIEKIEFKIADVEERILVAPILVPNQLIYRNNINGEPANVFASKDTIKAVQEHYLRMGNQNNSNLEHQGEAIKGVTFVQHWIVRNSAQDTINAYGFSNIPEGTWCTIAKLSQELWDEYIKTGKVKGLSVEGLLGIKQVEMTKNNNNKQNKVKMNKQTINQIVMNAIEQVRLAADLAEFKDVDGKSYFATELVIDAIVTDADGNLIVDAEFIIDGNKYKTDASGAIKEIEPVEAEEVIEEEAPVELAEGDVVEEVIAPAVDEATDDVQALKDKIAELEKEVADLEAKNVDLEAKLVEKEAEKVEMSKQTPASKGIKDAPVAVKSIKGETMTEMLNRLR